MTTIEKIRAEMLKTIEDTTSSNRIDPMMRNIGREQCLAIIDKYAGQEPLLPMGKYPKTSFPCDSEDDVKQTKQEPCDDAYDKVLAYLKANVDDFPDYHEAIEAVLKMKGGE